jgi:hypothetical protein
MRQVNATVVAAYEGHAASQGGSAGRCEQGVLSAGSAGDCCVGRMELQEMTTHDGQGRTHTDPRATHPMRLRPEVCCCAACCSGPGGCCCHASTATLLPYGMPGPRTTRKLVAHRKEAVAGPPEALHTESIVLQAVLLRSHPEAAPAALQTPAWCCCCHARPRAAEGRCTRLHEGSHRFMLLLMRVQAAVACGKQQVQSVAALERSGFVSRAITRPMLQIRTALRGLHPRKKRSPSSSCRCVCYKRGFM